MSELSDDFDCTITNWEYIYGLCRNVANRVKTDSFEPDVVVALARGGWFPGRCLCDFLGLDDLTSLKMEHYVGTAESTGEPTIRYPIPEGSVNEKHVLVVDDIADTGRSLSRATEYIDQREPTSIKTATLQLLDTSEFTPDFVGENLEEWTWVVYPWNFIEDMIDLIYGSMQKSDKQSFTCGTIRQLLYEYHDINRIEMEIAQPNRLNEVLVEMERRGKLGKISEDKWQIT